MKLFLTIYVFCFRNATKTIKILLFILAINLLLKVFEGYVNRKDNYGNYPWLFLSTPKGFASDFYTLFTFSQQFDD
jgi:hypothetical protein